MILLTETIKKEIQNTIISNAINNKFAYANKNIPSILEKLYSNIPDNKRISYGKVYTIKVLSKYLYEKLLELNENTYKIGVRTFQKSTDHRSSGIGLGILSFYGLTNYKLVLPWFEKAAASKHWDIREYSQMFFRKIIKKYPEEVKIFLLKQVISKDPNIRRFVSETLRPVVENKWILKNPEYTLSILKYLFKEKDAYPRTSVGNNLSDLSRNLSDLIFNIVKELVDSNDKNSYWIAYRACRNLVKINSEKAMDILKVDEYKYKNRIYKRNENN